MNNDVPVCIHYYSLSVLFIIEECDRFIIIMYYVQLLKLVCVCCVVCMGCSYFGSPQLHMFAGYAFLFSVLFGYAIKIKHQNDWQQHRTKDGYKNRAKNKESKKQKQRNQLQITAAPAQEHKYKINDKTCDKRQWEREREERKNSATTKNTDKSHHIASNRIDLVSKWHLLLDSLSSLIILFAFPVFLSFYL